MSKRMHVGLAMLGMVGMVLTASSVFALSQFPFKANRYRAALVRAMDQCSSGAISVVGAGDVPNGDCPQANSTTDDSVAPLGATMNYGVITVSRTASLLGRVGFFGLGFKPGNPISRSG